MVNTVQVKRKRFVLVMLILILATLLLSLVLLAVLVGPVLLWRSQPEQPLQVWIVDKTVPVPDYREHKGLMWVLNHNKYTNIQTREPFAFSTDYFGFFPVSKQVYDIRPIPADETYPDLIYLADTYGVYRDDYFQPNVRGVQSPIIYGGLESQEVEAIRQNTGQGNTIIGEFNIVASPTNARNRAELGQILRTDWNGWKGRYFRELARNVEVPDFIIKNFELQSGQPWSYTGAGYVLVSDNDQIAVLENGIDVGSRGLQVEFAAPYQAEFSVSASVAYHYWFEFITPDPGTEVLASYNLDLTAAGQARLAALGLPAQFPAMIRNRNTQYTAYYFAGDFADLQNVSRTYEFAGLAWLQRQLSGLNPNSDDYFYWNGYVPVMQKILADVATTARTRLPAQSGQIGRPTPTPIPNTATAAVTLHARTWQQGFQIQRDGQWQDFFIRGVNLGAARPGYWFTEFPQDEAVYLQWFTQMGEMNANCLRVYTLLPPAFYQALAIYNQGHADNPLRLLQEIWPEENPAGGNYLAADYLAAYQQEIRYVIDAVHGQTRIKNRLGRAYGIYTSDVSSYVLGYLVGRELEPQEVVATNEANPGYAFKGQYLSTISGASATEAWLAQCCDYAIAYETDCYKSQHPTAIVSWPTLDPLTHDTEWNKNNDKSKEYNDSATIDINHIARQPALAAGFFGAYHIYPNYPDFMNNEPAYDTYRDDQGRLRYGGYLAEFIRQHSQYPAVVAEFGLATGQGNAHPSPDGYHHGGLSEEAQGEGIVRLMQAIRREGYAGGIIFEWMDEWAKKTWITEGYMIPYERHVLWHNSLDPEQNYGLLAMESVGPGQFTEVGSGDGRISRIELAHDTSYLYLRLTLDGAVALEKERIYIGLDTYERTKGEFRLAPDLAATAGSGLEFLLDLGGRDGASLLATPDYNAATGHYASTRATQDGIFNAISVLTTRERVTRSGQVIPAQYHNNSVLRYGYFMTLKNTLPGQDREAAATGEGTAGEYNINGDASNCNWFIQGDQILVRLPWGLLNFSDPSESRVLNDPAVELSPLRDALRTTRSDGIVLNALIVDQRTRQQLDWLPATRTYQWPDWQTAQYQARLKKSYPIIRDYFARLADIYGN